MRYLHPDFYTKSLNVVCNSYLQYISIRTSHISSAQESRVSSGYCIGRHKSKGTTRNPEIVATHWTKESKAGFKLKVPLENK